MATNQKSFILTRDVIRNANILSVDNVDTILRKFNLRLTKENIDICKRAQRFVNDPKSFDLSAGRATMEQVIKEYKCVGFWFVTCVPYAKYVKLVFISKKEMLRYCTDILRPSTIDSGNQKRDEGGKPCYRFNRDFLRKQQPFWVGKEYTIDLQNMTYSAFCKAFREDALRRNMGCMFETLTAKQLGKKQIGENDKLSHLAHTDLQEWDNDEIQYEVKLENGYITSHMWTVLHQWEG